MTRLYGPLERPLANLPLFPICPDGVLIRPVLKRSSSSIILLGNTYTPCPGRIAPKTVKPAEGSTYEVPFTDVLLEGSSALNTGRHIQFNETVEQRVIVVDRKQVFDQVSHIASQAFPNSRLPLEVRRCPIAIYWCLQ